MMAERLYTPEQTRIIEHAGGHAVVSAVAGSGKTETLIGRIRHLLKTHQANQIAVVMFNASAADSFRRRFQSGVGGTMPEIRTFNSMGNRIVNRFVELGHLPRASISDKDYQRFNIAKAALHQASKSRLDGGQDLTKDDYDAFVTFISIVKSGVDSPETVLSQGGDYGERAKRFPEAFVLFEAERRRLKLRFFEDQLYDPVMAIRANPDLQAIITNRIDHLIVDEAQDVNGTQIELLRIIAGSRAKVMIVGDEDQAIYEWRGAKPDFITKQFERQFPGATRYALSHTFRFGHALSIAASQLISRNRNRNPKISISYEGTPSTRVSSLPDTGDAKALARSVCEELEAGRCPSDIAVLVRTYSLAMCLQLELLHRGVAHFVYGRPPLMRIPEISVLIAVLRLASDCWEGVSEEDVHNQLRCLLTVPSVYLESSVVNSLVGQVTQSPRQIGMALRSVITPDTASYRSQQLKDRADLLVDLAQSGKANQKAGEILALFLSRTDFNTSVRKQSPTAEGAETKIANVQAFGEIAQTSGLSVSEFLDSLDELSDASDVDPPQEPHIWIGSIHRAKGAQWPVVYVPGLVEGRFPADGLDEAQEEAERRLFYVAMTRAVDQLYLVHPSDRLLARALADPGTAVEPNSLSDMSSYMWEMGLPVAQHAAQALQGERQFQRLTVGAPEIVNAYFTHFERSKAWAYQKPMDVPRPAETAPSWKGPSGVLSVGVHVSHPSFGNGKVAELMSNQVVKIWFEKVGFRYFRFSDPALELHVNEGAATSRA